MTDNKSSPKLQHFRQILFWPLRLIPPEGVKEKIEENGFALTIKNILTQSPHWEAQDDLYGRGMNPDPVTSYAEFVYFHPFIRRFLYGDPRNENALHICQRTDVKTIQITLREGKTFEFNVDRVHLYLFAIEVTLLVIEISSIGLADMKLEDVENVLDQFRHAYPPYWENGKAGHSPKRVLFFDENKHQLARSEYDNQQSYLNFVEKQKTSPVAEHWRFLLEPFVPHTFQKVEAISYEQIEDERIPHIAFLAFDDPTKLTKGDFMRLTFADAWGESDTLPYSPNFPHFSENFEAKYCYDRFWKESESPNQNPKYNWMTTRYLCCGYAFTMIGQDEGFFTDSTAGRLADFRHHYFQMGLIVHFHKAALLMLWDELAQAVANFSRHPQQFRQQVDKILEKLLHFTHRYWFTEVSNHVQPKELFDMWSEHLGSRDLFNRLMKEVQDTQQYLDMREQKQQTETTNRLTVVATLGLIFVLTLTFFSTPLGQKLGWIWSPVILGTFTLGVGFMLYYAKKLSRFFERIVKK